MAKGAIVSVNITEADMLKVSAAALSDEARILRRVSRQHRRTDRAASEVARDMADYLESRADQKRKEAAILESSDAVS